MSRNETPTSPQDVCSELTIRDKYIIAAMQSLLTVPRECHPNDVPKVAVRIADSVLKEAGY